MATERSEFDAWFCEQFNDAPLGPDTLAALRKTIAERKEDLARDELFLREQEIIASQYRAALYAWQAAVTK